MYVLDSSNKIVIEQIQVNIKTKIIDYLDRKFIVYRTMRRKHKVLSPKRIYAFK